MSLSAEKIEHNLATRLIGKTVIVYESVDSTNEILKKISRERKYNGLAIFARHQQKGKGRNGRIWQAPQDSSILCSTLVFLEESVHETFGAVMLASAIATAQAISKTFPSAKIRIKWPNDIYCGKRKLAGVLIESSTAYFEEKPVSAFIIGIGINCKQEKTEFPAEIADAACSISQILNRTVSDEEMIFLAKALLEELDFRIVRIANNDFSTLRDEWLQLAGDLDDSISVIQGNRKFSARIVDIDVTDGSLLVQDYNGMIVHLQQNAAKII